MLAQNQCLLKLRFDKMGQRYDQDLELRNEMLEKYRTRRQCDDNSIALKQATRISIAFDHSFGQSSDQSASTLARFAPCRARSPQLHPNRVPLPYLLLWLRSGKNLDLCLLALCSCILSLLCHQSVSSLPSSPTLTSNSSAPVSSPVAGLSRIDLVIKAGLFTTHSQTEEATERSQQ